MANYKSNNSNRANSELRQDLVSGDWILIAPSRRKRPHDLVGKKTKRKRASKKTCPFENPQKSGQPKPFLIYKGKDGVGWEIQVFENKYPALYHRETCAVMGKVGPFSVAQGIGHQDLVVTRDHNKNFSHLPNSTARRVFHAFQARYKMLAEDRCMAYISIFHNWGPSAGATVYHPHYQIIALPIIPPDVAHSLRGSAAYFRRKKRCVHCEMIKWEKKEKRRVIYENKGAISFVPFVSRSPFEVRIFPKSHQPFFESTPARDLEFIVEALQKSLLSLGKKLKDPDYNFFIHTSPIKGKSRHKHYHWHLEILPKVSIPAGFELATEVDINVVDPDEAGKFLRVR
jgi:UDPglucose--hexose-1-phosphate uridylyltransferase